MYLDEHYNRDNKFDDSHITLLYFTKINMYTIEVCIEMGMGIPMGPLLSW